MTILLDTCAYSELLRGNDEIARIVRRAAEIRFSTVVIGELLFGFRGGRKYKQNCEQLDSFLDNPYVALLPVTRTTADRFSRIAIALRQNGTPIPTNDVWIAAHAIETGAELVTLDSHFNKVEGLVVRPEYGEMET